MEGKEEERKIVSLVIRYAVDEQVVNLPIENDHHFRKCWPLIRLLLRSLKPSQHVTFSGPLRSWANILPCGLSSSIEFWVKVVPL